LNFCTELCISHTYSYHKVYSNSYNFYVWTHKIYTTKIYTGWRRLIGSPKLQIIFHKRATKYRAVLREMTYKDKGSYESSPPCTHITWYIRIHTISMYELIKFTHQKYISNTSSYRNGTFINLEITYLPMSHGTYKYIVFIT